MSQWQIVAHVNEVANPGDYVLLPGPYGRQIVVSNFDGLIKVWNNRCPHRGARIHTEPHGNGPAACKYHGRCAKPGQPNFMDYPSVVGPTWVYASLDGTADRSPAYLTGFSLPPGCKLFHRLDMVLPCSVHVAIENALDLSDGFLEANLTTYFLGAGYTFAFWGGKFDAPKCDHVGLQRSSGYRW